MNRRSRVGREAAVVADGSRRFIVTQRNELYLLILEAEVVEGLLNEVGIFVAYLTELRLRYPDEKRASARVTVAGGLQPGVVGVPVDLFFQRVKDAQPRIGSKSWT